MSGHPDVDRVVVLPRMRWSEVSAAWLRRSATALRALRAARYDVSIDLQGLARSAALVLLARAELRIVSAFGREGAALISRPIANPGRPHAADEYLRCAQFLGAADEKAVFHLPVDTNAARAIAARLDASGVADGSPLVVVNPCLTSAHKTWRAERWVELLEELPHEATVIVVGDTGQREAHASLARRCTRPVVDLSGSTTLPELIALLDRCAVHIAPDTGSVHIAAALGKPVVTFYGPTDAARHHPYAQDGTRYDAARPCGLFCPTLCRRRPCLERHNPAELAAIAAQYIAAASDSSPTGRGQVLG